MKNYFVPIICCLAVQAFAQQSTNGTLQYSNQTPAALVDIIILKNEQIIDEISTDENGHFSTTLANDTYTFHIEEAGIILHTQQVVIKDNQEIGIIIIPKNETEVALNGSCCYRSKKIS